MIRMRCIERHTRWCGASDSSAVSIIIRPVISSSEHAGLNTGLVRLEATGSAFRSTPTS
jgi:hypothetical protein